MDVCSWIRNLPSPTDWPESDSQLTLQLASSNEKSVLFKAEPTSGSNTEALVTFSISLHGFFHPPANPNKTLWVSNPCQLASTRNPVSLTVTLLHQLVQETIARAPASNDSMVAPFDLDPESISRAFSSSPPEPAFSRFFNLVLLCRLFWLCISDAPAEAGLLFFQALAPSLHTFLQCKPAMSAFMAAVGADGELLFMRTLGYMLAKWFILREVREVSPSPVTDNRHLGLSYASESHGLLLLKGYAPVASMSRAGVNGARDYSGIFDAKESVLKYALAHQQLEAVIQLEYSAAYHAGFIRVGVRLDNLRIHVTRLGFGGPEEQEQPYAHERYHPTRVRVWAGPVSGSSCPASLTLGRSTDNPETEAEARTYVKGSFGKSKSSKAKAMVKSSTRVRRRDWRWEQHADGNTAIFEGVLCNYENGAKAATWQPRTGSNGEVGPRGGVQRRCWNGGLVFAGDEYGEEVSWRMGREEVMREMDGGDLLKWRLGGKIWLSYWPCDSENSHYETRSVEWCEEVKLPLASGKYR
eukprot:TRINITY_DN18206_c0_g1_i1.p1 TRINITY_DN18206_c0_g1~~TRINITY_DN18206_c0_g1_i1.p1  ORF type:complete len:526 (+),score=21.17 TRINITY_DN18206_c0_g1_i1:299-1876(+)